MRYSSDLLRLFHTEYESNHYAFSLNVYSVVCQLYLNKTGREITKNRFYLKLIERKEERKTQRERDRDRKKKSLR